MRRRTPRHVVAFAEWANRETVWLSAVVTVLSLALAVGCDPSSASPSGKDDSDDEVEAIPVETLELRTEDFDDIFEVPAKARADEEITVGAEVGGRILGMEVEEGDRVSAGETIAQIDTDVDSARIRQLENRLSSAQREYERTKKLAEDGLATPQELDQAETTLEDARLALDEAKLGVSKGRIDSPIGGVIQKRYLDAGEYSAPGEPVVDVVAYDEVIVEGYVPQKHIDRIATGDQVEVTLPATSQTVTGEVSHRAVNASPRSGTYRVEVRLDNKEGRILPGMSARMYLVHERYPEAILAPREAILQGYTRAEAMVLPGDDEVGRAKLRVVELGPGRGPDVVVTEGLDDGQRLIVRGHRGLVNSAKVRQVDHYDSIEQMRQGGGELDLGGDDGKDNADDGQRSE